jgi:hypothetical protein
MNKMSKYKYNKFRTMQEDKYLAHYKAVPKDFVTFLASKTYLGKFTCELKNISSHWLENLKKIEKNGICKYVVLQCSKTTDVLRIMYGCYMPYLIYRISCLQDPWDYFNIKEEGRIDIVIYNSAPSPDEDKNFNYMQQAMSLSPWFQKTAGILRSNGQFICELPMYRWLFISPNRSYKIELKPRIVAGIIDATDTPNDFEGHKRMICQAFHDTVKDRLPSRISPGKMIIIAKHDDELSFLRDLEWEMQITDKILKMKESDGKINYNNQLYDRIMGSTPALPANAQRYKPEPIIQQSPQPSTQQERKYRQDVTSPMLFPRKNPSLIKLGKLMVKVKEENHAKLMAKIEQEFNENQQKEG